MESDHVFRLSPLGIVVVEQLMFKPIYLAASAWEVPFHDKVTLDRFLYAAVEALGLDDLSQCELDADRADLLGISDVPEVIAEILGVARRREEVLARGLAQRAEVSAVEEKVREALAKLGATEPSAETPRDSEASAPSPAASGKAVGTQESLAFVMPAPTSSSTPGSRVVKIPIPDGFAELKIDGSTSAPSVFWALAFAHANSLGPQSGAELTRIINEHLRDDYQQLEATNISRLLRGKSMLAQPWLRREGKERRWTFSLAHGWREHWCEVFGMDAPA